MHTHLKNNSHVHDNSRRRKKINWLINENKLNHTLANTQSTILVTNSVKKIKIKFNLYQKSKIRTMYSVCVFTMK